MTTLAHDVVGIGRPIVFLHGAMSARRVFGYQVLGLSRSHRVIVPDLPGHGQSAWDPTVPWLDQATTSVVDLVHELDASEPVVVGWSLGGLVARAAVNHLGGSRLVLVGTGANGIAAETRTAMGRRLLGDFPRFARGMVRTFTSSGVSAETEDWLFALALSTGLDVHVASLVRTDAVLETPLPPGTVSVIGARDQIVPRSDAPTGVTREVVFERSGHAVFLEESNAFNALVAEVAT